jgi:glycerol uptake facilitator-like aquaporin
MPRRLAAEFLGTLLLLATVVGSGIMGERLAGGNDAIALLGNTMATGAILVVLIEVFGPVSGAHFNPVVTLVMVLRRDIGTGAALAYLLVQVAGALTGMALAHAMFETDVVQIGAKVRAGPAQALSEFVATFGLLATILGCLAARPKAIPAAVGLYITAAYWFTASTSFANPAVTLARSFTTTFAGIRPSDAPFFVAAQILGALAAYAVFRWLVPAVRAPRDESR